MRIAAFLAVVLVAAGGLCLPASAEDAETEAGTDAEPGPFDAEPRATDPANEPAENAEENEDAGPRGEEADTGDPGEEKALNLEADQIVYEGDSFTCTENIVITYGSSRVECDKVLGTIAEVEKTIEETGEKTRAKAITSIVATGSPIIMVSEQRRARCLKAVYDFAEGKLILTGSEEQPPEITQEGRTARGKRIIFLINEEDFIIEKGGITFPIEGSTLPGILD